MLFNSYIFLIFLGIIFFLYLVIPKKNQNLLILIGSYVFYGWWDWRFLFLIATSTLIDFYCGLSINQKEKKQEKKKWLVLSLSANLLFLGFFKYFNFFIDSLSDAIAYLGLSWNISTLTIILPVGISFYTFQSMSYSLDIYNGKLKPTRDMISFMAYVAFFPQLVAGPIERASNLLPQFLSERTLRAENMIKGCRLILWGFFQKVVIADNLALVVDRVYENPQATGSSYLLAAYAFTFQIYGDFAGYSNIARGCAKLFGFELMINFRAPYLASSIKDFWKRWHISLSTWFRDYVYLPLGGNRCSTSKFIRNIMITFLLSGLWHGANWTFVMWGLIHGIFYIIYTLVFVNNRKIKIPRIIGTLFTFHIVVIAYIFFRSESLNQSLNILLTIVTSISVNDFLFDDLSWIVFSLAGFTLSSDYLIESHKKSSSKKLPRYVWVSDYILLIGIFLLGRYFNEAFIYFQF